MIIILLTLLFVFFPSPAFALDECPFRIQPRIVFDGRGSSFALKACQEVIIGNRGRERGCAILGYHRFRSFSPAYARGVIRHGSFRPFRFQFYGFTYKCDFRSRLRFGILSLLVR